MLIKHKSFSALFFNEKRLFFEAKLLELKRDQASLCVHGRNFDLTKTIIYTLISFFIH